MEQSRCLQTKLCPEQWASTKGSQNRQQPRHRNLQEHRFFEKTQFKRHRGVQHRPCKSTNPEPPSKLMTNKQQSQTKSPRKGARAEAPRSTGAEAKVQEQGQPQEQEQEPEATRGTGTCTGPGRGNKHNKNNQASSPKTTRNHKNMNKNIE